MARFAANYLLIVPILLSACGQSTVQFAVVRPSVINVRSYGGSVQVAGFLAGSPDWGDVAGQFKAEVADRIAAGVPGAVRLVDFGGSVVVSGRIDDYGVRLTEGRRAEMCTDTVREGTGETAQTKTVQNHCVMRWNDWQARMAVAVQLVSSAGQMILLQPMVATATGRSEETRDAAPAPPNLHPVLQGLRGQLAAKIANLVAPHREMVAAILYDCADPAKQVCAQGVQEFAHSQYDAAVAAFTDALGLLQRAKADKSDQAKVLWNRGIVFEYSRRFAEASADFAGANALDPSSAYAAKQADVDRERLLHEKLVDEGLAPVQPPLPTPAAPGNRP